MKEKEIKSSDVELLAVLVKIDGKVYQLQTSAVNSELYLTIIDSLEDGIRIIDTPFECLNLEIEEDEI